MGRQSRLKAERRAEREQRLALRRSARELGAEEGRRRGCLICRRSDGGFITEEHIIPESLGSTEKAMRRIEEEAARMGVLVEDLLTLARLDEVRERPHAPVDLSALARDAVHDARATDGDRRIDLHRDGRVDAVVLGDEDQLRQVLANLVRNAFVHTPAGTAVDVAVRDHDGHVELEVSDEGPGLPTDEPQALFERFWRAEGGRERGRAGSGLGLAIVAGIVEAHGGSVHAGTAETGGARFVVTLPSASVQA